MKCSFEAYEGKEKYIFISYAHKDSKIIMPIIEALHDNGYHIWYDDGIHPGDEWRETIASRLIGSSLVLGFFSQNSLESQNCKNEINFAMSRKIDLICIHLEQVQMSIGLEMELSSYQALFYYAYDNVNSFFNKLEKSEKIKCCLGEIEKEVVKVEPIVQSEPVVKIEPIVKIEPVFKENPSIAKPIKNKSKYDDLSPQEQINLYEKINDKVFDFYIDEENHVRICKYYDSPERTSIQIPEFVYGFRTLFSAGFEHDFKGAFSSVSHLNKIRIHSNLIDLSFMFYNCNISKLDLSDWDVSNVFNMFGLFFNSKTTQIGNLSNWNVSNVTSMNGLFCKSELISIGNLNSWDVSNVTDMRNMFYKSKFKFIGSLDFWNVSNVTDMGWLFMESQLTCVGDLKDWNVSKVTDMSSMFENSQLNTIGNLDNWNVSKVKNMYGMFDNTQLTKPKWYK